MSDKKFQNKKLYRGLWNSSAYFGLMNLDLTAKNLIVLTGPQGNGKTYLAKYFIQIANEKRGIGKDRILYIEGDEFLWLIRHQHQLKWLDYLFDIDLLVVDHLEVGILSSMALDFLFERIKQLSWIGTILLISSKCSKNVVDKYGIQIHLRILQLTEFDRSRLFFYYSRFKNIRMSKYIRSQLKKSNSVSEILKLVTYGKYLENFM